MVREGMAIKFRKLTKGPINHLKPGQKLLEHGIEFQRLSNGDGCYTVNIMVDGIRIHRAIGNESAGVTRGDAERFIEIARTDARTGRLNLPKGKKTHMSFEEAAEQYQKRLKEMGGKDLKSKKHRLKDHLVPFFGKEALASIVTFDVERYKKLRLDKKATVSTVNRELAVFSHLMNRAVEWGWLVHKQCAIHKFPESNGRITYLTVHQAFRLLEAAKKASSPHIYLFIKIGLETGMRKLEILSIRISDIDLEQNAIYIPNAKAGDRVQPITKGLARYLREHLAHLSDTEAIWLFPSPHSHSGHQTEIRKSFITAVKETGLNPALVVRHTLRHTAITHLVQAGVDLPTVKRISGHKTLRMVERYAHQNSEHIQKAMDLLEARYQNSGTDGEGSLYPLHENYTKQESH